jgi:hypothetical protein
MHRFHVRVHYRTTPAAFPNNPWRVLLDPSHRLVRSWDRAIFWMDRRHYRHLEINMCWKIGQTCYR